MSSANIKESLCVRLLSFLNAKQRAGFEAYLECPLFNTNTSLVKVFTALKEKALHHPEVQLSAEALFSETQLNPGLFPKYATQLVTQLEGFIPFWEQKDDPRHGYADAFAFWKRVGLDQDLLERQYRKMKRKAAKLPPSEWQMFHAFELEHRYLQYKAGHPRKDQASLFETAESLFDQLNLVFRLRYRSARKILERFLSLTENTRSIDLEHLDLESLPLLGQAYYRAAVLLEEDQLSPKEAIDFHHWLRDRQSQFSKQDKEDLYSFLLDLCIQNANRKIEFIRLLDRVYMEMLEGKLLNNHTHLPGSHFKNIVSTNIRLGELVTAANFIDLYKKELAKKDHKVLLPYTKGLVSYHKEEFREAVLHFRQALESSSVDIHWGLETRLMLWRSYYEILETMDAQEHAEFLGQYDAVRIYVSRRDHLSEEQKLGYDHFIRIFNRLARMKEDLPTPKELVALKAEVMGLPHIKQRTWLCQTIDRQLEALR